MLTIHKDSFDMIEQDVASGTLEKSKILNCLFWKSNDTCDPAKVLNQSDNQPSRPSSNPNVTDSMLDKLDKHALWDALSAPNLEDDGCEYCTMQPVERQRFPKHFMYTNGKLTCPLLLSQRTCV
ncbi:uncharacterized protein LOC128298963 [Anopheles moucheti]|uniref:uncharacterized protein LOC128298963 n=1 Tax=Anopheles moucheti TaxID=186751 RepID=UPI0022F07980|nr:uncharacterized protein LOC128298963 [Anopheles moucheti]